MRAPTLVETKATDLGRCSKLAITSFRGPIQQERLWDDFEARPVPKVYGGLIFKVWVWQGRVPKCRLLLRFLGVFQKILTGDQLLRKILEHFWSDDLLSGITNLPGYARLLCCLPIQGRSQTLKHWEFLILSFGVLRIKDSTI